MKTTQHVIFVFLALCVMVALSYMGYCIHKRVPGADSPRPMPVSAADTPELDVARVQKEAVSFLCEYVRIDTTTQHADYESALTLFERHAHEDGFETQRIVLPSGGTCLVVLLRGSNKDAQTFAVHQHMDVVPVGDSTQWNDAPFSGACKDGIIYGRGVQDMKGVGIAQYAGLKLFKEQHGTPQRSVCLILVPDEEIGGFTGAGQLVATPEFKALNIGYVLDEGVASGVDNTIHVIATQRKPLQIVVESCGAAAHGSRLLADNPAHRLIAFLDRIRALHEKHQVKARTEGVSVGLLTSLNITGLDAGDVDGRAMNSIPARARATLDIRVAPQEKMASVTQMLDNLCTEFPGVTYQVKAAVEDYDNPPAAMQSGLRAAIDDAAQYVHCVTQSIHAEIASDLRFYVKQGIVGVGVTPFTTSMQNHEINESLPVADLVRGAQFFYRVMKALCG